MELSGSDTQRIDKALGQKTEDEIRHHRDTIDNVVDKNGNEVMTRRKVRGIIVELRGAVTTIDIPNSGFKNADDFSINFNAPEGDALAGTSYRVKRISATRFEIHSSDPNDKSILDIGLTERPGRR